MSKSDLVTAVADKAGLSKKDAGAAVDAVLDTVGETLAKGESLTLPGFGTFKVSERAARTGRNPQTGAEIQIPASKAVGFKAGKTLKDRVQ